ncbi:MAG: SDR family oxidoreductase [Burkholderiaceae bacterium]|nr:SDR family oxidoreductase [Burkholderiaceae bacterium]
MSKDLDQQVAIVTGAASGIGRAVALAYAGAGARVVVSDISEAGGHETVAQIAAAGGESVFVRADASSAADNQRLVAEAVKRYGALHLSCNTAGVGGDGCDVGEYPLEEWQRIIGINLSGVFYGMRYQIPAMLASGGGAIVNMASILSQVGFRGHAAYVAAKHGLVGLSRTAALEYAARGIRINSVGPAFIDTPLLANLPPEARQGLVGLHPMGRLGSSPEVAELVLWLSSRRASFVTGGYYPVDGGYLSQ